MVRLFREENPGNEHARDQKEYENEQSNTDDLDAESCMEKLCQEAHQPQLTTNTTANEQSQSQINENDNVSTSLNDFFLCTEEKYWSKDFK